MAMGASDRPVALASCAAVAALALDQATKALAIANADILAGGLRVLPGFNLVLHRNTGVSFGLLGEAPPIALAVPALGAVALLAVLALRVVAVEPVERVVHEAVPRLGQEALDARAEVVPVGKRNRGDQR